MYIYAIHHAVPQSNVWQAMVQVVVLAAVQDVVQVAVQANCLIISFRCKWCKQCRQCLQPFFPKFFCGFRFCS